MSIALPSDWTTIPVPTAADFNREIRDFNDMFVNPPFCHAYSEVDQNTLQDVWVKVDLSAVYRDTANAFDPGTPGELVVPEDGDYFIAAQLRWRNRSSYDRVLEVRADGVPIITNTLACLGVGGHAHHINAWRPTVTLQAGQILTLWGLSTHHQTDQYLTPTGGTDPGTEPAKAEYGCYLSIRWTGLSA